MTKGYLVQNMSRLFTVYIYKLLMYSDVAKQQNCLRVKLVHVLNSEVEITTQKVKHNASKNVYRKMPHIYAI